MANPFDPTGMTDPLFQMMLQQMGRQQATPIPQSLIQGQVQNPYIPTAQDLAPTGNSSQGFVTQDFRTPEQIDQNYYQNQGYSPEQIQTAEYSKKTDKEMASNEADRQQQAKLKLLEQGYTAEDATRLAQDMTSGGELSPTDYGDIQKRQLANVEAQRQADIQSKLQIVREQSKGDFINKILSATKKIRDANGNEYEVPIFADEKGKVDPAVMQAFTDNLKRQVDALFSGQTAQPQPTPTAPPQTPQRQAPKGILDQLLEAQNKKKDTQKLDDVTKQADAKTAVARDNYTQGIINQLRLVPAAQRDQLIPLVLKEAASKFGSSYANELSKYIDAAQLPSKYWR